MYLKLFNSITDAIKLLAQWDDRDGAVMRLVKAQMDAEEMYIDPEAKKWGDK
jgi:hypothetical protein